MKNSLNRMTALFRAMGLVLVMAFASAQALAQEAPDALVKRVSQEVLDAEKNDKDVNAGDYRRVRELVEGKILPHMDFEKTTAMVAGRRPDLAGGQPGAEAATARRISQSAHPHLFPGR